MTPARRQRPARGAMGSGVTVLFLVLLVGGAEGLIGHVGIVRRRIDPLGDAAVDGEPLACAPHLATQDEPPPGRRVTGSSSIRCTD